MGDEEGGFMLNRDSVLQSATSALAIMTENTSETAQHADVPDEGQWIDQTSRPHRKKLQDPQSGSGNASVGEVHAERVYLVGWLAAETLHPEGLQTAAPNVVLQQLLRAAEMAENLLVAKLQKLLDPLRGHSRASEAGPSQEYWAKADREKELGAKKRLGHMRRENIKMKEERQRRNYKKSKDRSAPLRGGRHKVGEIESDEGNKDIEESNSDHKIQEPENHDA